jgi:hypothetical protein
MDAGVSGATWLDGLTSAGACISAQGCEADYTSTSTVPSSGKNLMIDADGFYHSCPSESICNTKFQRKIIITCLDSSGGVDNLCATDYIIKVVTQVSWDQKATILNPGFSANDCYEGKNCITAQWTLYDWYNYVNQ